MGFNVRYLHATIRVTSFRRSCGDEKGVGIENNEEGSREIIKKSILPVFINDPADRAPGLRSE